MDDDWPEKRIDCDAMLAELMSSWILQLIDIAVPSIVHLGKALRSSHDRPHVQARCDHTRTNKADHLCNDSAAMSVLASLPGGTEPAAVTTPLGVPFRSSKRGRSSMQFTSSVYQRFVEDH